MRAIMRPRQMHGQTTGPSECYHNVMLQVSFPEIARVLDELRSNVPPAESHGCLCGALCTTADYPLERWLDEIVPEPPTTPTEEGSGILKLLFEDTTKALRGDQMEFEPLLPPDDVALAHRAEALAQWCQGFLYGFGTGRAMPEDEMPPAVDEILRDLTHIGRASVELEEGNEEEEQAYTEIVEYVRAGVQLIHDELDGLRSASERPRSH